MMLLKNLLIKLLIGKLEVEIKFKITINKSLRKIK